MSWLNQFDSISGNNNSPFSWTNTGGTNTNEVCTDQPKMENGEYVTTPSGSLIYEKVCRDNVFDDTYGRNRNNSRNSNSGNNNSVNSYDGTSVHPDCNPTDWTCQMGKCPPNPTDPATKEEIEDGCEQNVTDRMFNNRDYGGYANTRNNNRSGNNQSDNNQSGNNQSGNNRSGNNQSGNTNTGNNNQSGNTNTGNTNTGNTNTGNTNTGNTNTGNQNQAQNTATILRLQNENNTLKSQLREIRDQINQLLN